MFLRPTTIDATTKLVKFLKDNPSLNQEYEVDLLFQIPGRILTFSQPVTRPLSVILEDFPFQIPESANDILLYGAYLLGLEVSTNYGWIYIS